MAAGGSGPRSADEFYATFCVTCHEADGPGDGPAAPFCRVAPADFTRAEFKMRSTASGDGAMPAFDWLAADDIDPLVERIKAFSSRWQREAAPRWARRALPGRARV